MFFDDLEILRVIDRCERAGLGASLSSGLQLLQEVLSSPYPVYDDDACRSFIRELEFAKEAGLLSFTVVRMGGGGRPPAFSRWVRTTISTASGTSVDAARSRSGPLARL